LRQHEILHVGLMKLFRLQLLLLILISIPVSAQRRVAAEMEVKTLYSGKVSTVRSRLYCSASGRLVQVFKAPDEYYTITNPDGEFQVYFPKTNEVYAERKADFSDRDNLFYLFLSGHGDDLGLSLYGYRLSSTAREGDGTVKRVYVPSLPGKGAAKIELVLENYLPIYLAYFNEGGSVVSKTYLSSYSRFSNLMLPLRVTSVQYTSKKDSTLTRTLYSNVTVDGNDGLFDFRVPADARPIKDVRGAKR